jgi:hypothetical protein
MDQIWNFSNFFIPHRHGLRKYLQLTSRYKATPCIFTVIKFQQKHFYWFVFGEIQK